MTADRPDDPPRCAGCGTTDRLELVLDGPRPVRACPSCLDELAATVADRADAPELDEDRGREA